MGNEEVEELPHEEQQKGEELKKMVVDHCLNEVLQSAVNAAFDAGSTDPLAFMGQYLVERQDMCPLVERVFARAVLGDDGSSTVEVDVECKVNGVVKVG